MTLGDRPSILPPSMRVLIAFVLRLLGALAVLWTVIGLRDNVGVVEVAVLLVGAVALVVASLRVGRFALR